MGSSLLDHFDCRQASLSSFLGTTVSLNVSFSFHFICRLSALTSSKLRDNNPNLTDLSDANRPTKISEMFSELYDNEWTDAFDELSRTNEEAVTIQHLNGLLTVWYFLYLCPNLKTNKH